MIQRKKLKSLVLRRKKKKNASQFQISYYDRKNKRMERELICGGGLLRFLYESRKGRPWAGILSHCLFSKLYGVYQNSPLSKKAIPGFIKKFQIQMEDYLRESERQHREEIPYRTFNEFFIRKFRDGARTFVKDKKLMPAFAEAKYLAYCSMAENEAYMIKGRQLSIGDILLNSKWEKVFRDGPIMIARLSPIDYHRFHFPDDGEFLDYYQLSGKLHSVNPVALRRKRNIFAVNERQVSILTTKNFGKLAYVEVGALAVGKIRQTHAMSKSFKRGDEKGFFLFGGSTVILIGEGGRDKQPPRWLPDQDLLDMTSKKIETFVRLGERVAHVVTQRPKIISAS
ncbi:MAG: phosphatidylserine decarboxylase [Oligoflexia bacterium]|nr:phosphatidylserine decarboxylase [Oligoflexia bacterium]